MLEKRRMEAKTKDSEITMLQSALEEKEGAVIYVIRVKLLLFNIDEIRTMRQLSIQQQREIDQLKTSIVKEKEGNNIVDLYGFTLYFYSS